MKKLSEQLKQYLIKCAKKSFKHNLKRKYKTCPENIFNGKKRGKPHILSAPINMDLENNYEETVCFFNKLRRLSPLKQRFIIDFKPIKTISPSAALIFTAEIDRIRHLFFKNKRMSVMDFHKWDETIKLQLRDIGMFNLLEIKNLPPNFNEIPSNFPEKFLKFQSGDQAIGEDANKLNILISALTTLPKQSNLQIGLTEAMTNSINHAYPDEYMEKKDFSKKMWYMSASVNTTANILTVMFYDEGIGIPESLPKTWPEAIKSALWIINKGDIIKAATQVSRTSTNEKTRGKGLKDIKNYIDAVGEENSYLEIYSLKGYYRYQTLKEKTSENKNPIEGTLIQWKVPI